MVRLRDLSSWDRQHILNADIPAIEGRPWVVGPAPYETNSSTL